MSVIDMVNDLYESFKIIIAKHKLNPNVITDVRTELGKVGLLRLISSKTIDTELRFRDFRTGEEDLYEYGLSNITTLFVKITKIVFMYIGEPHKKITQLNYIQDVVELYEGSYEKYIRFQFIVELPTGNRKLCTVADAKLLAKVNKKIRHLKYWNMDLDKIERRCGINARRMCQEYLTFLSYSELMKRVYNTDYDVFYMRCRRRNPTVRYDKIGKYLNEIRLRL